MSGVGPVVKAAVGEGTAEALVEEEEQECDLNALCGEPVSVTATVAFEEAVAFQLAEVVTKLVQPVGLRA